MAQKPKNKKTPPVSKMIEGYDKQGELLKAVLDLNPADDAHWTAAGLPDLTVLTEKLGRAVTRADLDALGEGYGREDAVTRAQAKTETYSHDDLVKAFETIETACAASEEAQDEVKDLIALTLSRDPKDSPFARILREQAPRSGTSGLRDLVKQRLGKTEKA